MIGIVFVIFSFLTVYTHYIDIIVDLFHGIRYTFYDLPNIYFLPVYPCNIMMWMNVIMIPFMFKRTKFTTYFADFIFIVGTLCGFCGLVLNTNFLDNPDFLNLYSLKAILSHVFLLYTCISLKVFNVAKIKTIPNLIACVCGGSTFILCNLYSNFVLRSLGREEVDSMFFKGASEELQFVNFYTIAIVGFILILIGTTIYETKVYPLEERWYYRFKVQKGEESHERNS